MAYTKVGVGTVANDNTGDPIRTAFQTLNANLVLLDTTFASSNELVIGDDPANLGTPAGFETTISSADASNDDITVTADGTGKVILTGTTTRVITVLTTPPSNVGEAGDTVGDFRIDAGFLYACVRDFDGGADCWLSVAIATF